MRFEELAKLQIRRPACRPSLASRRGEVTPSRPDVIGAELPSANHKPVTLLICQVYASRRKHFLFAEVLSLKTILYYKEHLHNVY